MNRKPADPRFRLKDKSCGGFRKDYSASSRTEFVLGFEEVYDGFEASLGWNHCRLGAASRTDRASPMFELRYAAIAALAVAGGTLQRSRCFVISFEAGASRRRNSG